MFGLLLVILGIGSLIGVILLDAVHGAFPSSQLGRAGRIVSESPNVNLAAYELSLFMTMVGLPLEAEESQNPFLLDAFPISLWTIVSCIMAFSWMCAFNVFRFERLGIAGRRERLIYNLAEELAAQSDSPEQGVQEAVQYVEGYSRHDRLVTKEKFLVRLSSQGGDLGVAAAKRLEALRDTQGL